MADLLGIAHEVPREAVKSVGGYWQPKYSVPNARMVEAVQMLARTEGLLLDPVYTGKVDGRPDRPGAQGLLHARREACCSCTPAGCRRCSPTSDVVLGDKPVA